jgi:hypothetical protein
MCAQFERLSIRLLWSQHAACNCAQFEWLSMRLFWSQHTACSSCAQFQWLSIRLLWSQHTVCNSDNGKETLNHCGGAWEFLNLIRVYNKELTFTSPLPHKKGQTDRQTARRVLQTGSNWQTEMVVNDMKVQLAFDFIHCNSFTFLDHLFLHRLQPFLSFLCVCVCVCV